MTLKLGEGIDLDRVTPTPSGGFNDDGSTNLDVGFSPVGTVSVNESLRSDVPRSGNTAQPELRDCWPLPQSRTWDIKIWHADGPGDLVWFCMTTSDGYPAAVHIDSYYKAEANSRDTVTITSILWNKQSSPQ
ncbi:hypothetical protein GCM10027610_001560 [Dactylosporangium cerinum]